MVRLYYILKQKTSRARKLAVFLFLCSLIAMPAYARAPSDPGYASQAPMWNQINAPSAWDNTTGSSNVVVAIIDTGVDINHEDLKNNIWTNIKEIPDNGKDDDNNGYVDDAHGWNFVNDNNDVSIASITRADDFDAVRHGTILAGLVGAVGNNGASGTGLNWDIKIMPLRAIDTDGSGSFDTITKAVNYAVNNGADIINISFVGEESDPDFEKSLRNAYNNGLLIVSAAGNSQVKDTKNLAARKRYPICADFDYKENWILGATSVDANDKLSDFAIYGPCVDITAPGENIFSTERYAPEAGLSEKFGGGWYGTSFSAPLVSGAAALLKSLRKQWGPQELISFLLDNSDPINDKNPDYSGQIGRGRLNVGKAVSAALAKLNSPEEKIGKLYYYLGDKIWSYNISNKSQTLIASSNGAKIISLAAADPKDNGNASVVLLIKRGQYYFIRIINSKGALLKEFSLPKFAGSKIELDATQAKVTFEDKGETTIVVEEKNIKKGISYFYKYGTDGTKMAEFYVPAPLRWDVDARSGQLALLQVKRNKLTLEIARWSGKRTLKWSLAGVKSFQDFKVWTSDNNMDLQAALALNWKEPYYKLIVDIANSSTRNDYLDTGDKTSKWSVFARPQRGILFFQDSVFGKALLTNAKGDIIKIFDLPKGIKFVPAATL